MSDDLKPCPFKECLGDASDINSTEEAEYVWYVYCQSCGAQGPTGTNKQEAIELWNERCDDA